MAAAKKRRRSVGSPQRGTSQITFDVIGLFLAAFGVFLAFPIFMAWDAGFAGELAVNGLTWLVGALHVTAPILFVALGGVVVLQPVSPLRKTAIFGLCCIAFGVLLAFAAGTFGLGDGTRKGYFESQYLKDHAGLLGEGEFWVFSQLFSTIGAHIAACFLVLLGLLLTSGRTLAQPLKKTIDWLFAAQPRSRSNKQTRQRAQRERVRRDPPRVRDDHTPRRETRSALTSLRSRILGEQVPHEDEEATTSAYGSEETHTQQERTEIFPDVEAEEEYEDSSNGEEVTEVYCAPENQDEEERTLQEQDIDEEQLTPQGRYRSEVLEDPSFVWKFPQPKNILEQSRENQLKPDTADQSKTKQALIETLSHFGIDSQCIGAVTGPHITRYELRLAPGVKMSKISQLKDDLAYALAATDIRILAPIPGKTAVGVEVPNRRRKMVRLGDVYGGVPKGASPLTIWLGKDIAGKAVCADLTKMPHLLVAGTTGAGKSGSVNAMLASVLLHASPRELRLVLVDPKQVELNHYESIPHLLTPVITSPRKAANALQNLVREMEERYGTMSLAKTRSLAELNRYRQEREQQPLPYILCVIDELADLMMVAPADVEDSIIRLAQKARAVGIHLVLATQSPRVDVITGMIKANVPSRIAFAVSSQTDSRVILDQNGAETLLGQGDMLYAPVGSSKLQRIQGAYIDEEQIGKITEYWRAQGEPEFREQLLEQVEDAPKEGAADTPEGSLDPNEDSLLSEAITLVVEMGTASTSMLQRRLRVGYTRAGRLIDMLERRGVISEYEGSKPRQVLVTQADLPQMLASLDSAESDTERSQNSAQELAHTVNS